MRLLTTITSTTLLLTATSAQQGPPDPSTANLNAATTLPSATPSWVPLTTLIPSAASATQPALDLRQVITAPPAALPTVDATQMSPITTINEGQVVNGVYQQVQVVYTQLFSAVPDQGPAPASGSIGLGTIVGEVGVVKTKREARPEPTEGAAAAEQMGGLVARGEGHTERRMQRRESLASSTLKEKLGAGSALALLVAITAMIVV